MNKELQPALRQPLVSGCLFRAIKDDMSNPCWLKGTLHIRNDSFGKVYTIEYEAGEYIYNQNSVIPSTIGQNTGLLDKLGREIFEGDIVRIWHERDDDEGFFTIGIVEYSPAEFYIRGDGHSITCHFHYNNSEREIIGNIHDNPELLPER